GETLRLVATPGASFTPRLFLAQLRRGLPPQVTEIPTTPLGPQPKSEDVELLSPHSQPPGVPIGGPSFIASVLRAGDGENHNVVAVVVSESGHKELIWVGVEDNGTAHALVVGNDAAEYVACAQAIVPANARKIEIEKGAGFAARVELEPERWTNVASE